MIYEVFIPFFSDKRKGLRISSDDYLPLQCDNKNKYTFYIEYVINKQPYNYLKIDINILNSFNVEYENIKDTNVMKVISTYSTLINIINKIIESENYALECSKDS